MLEKQLPFILQEVAQSFLFRNMNKLEVALYLVAIVTGGATVAIGIELLRRKIK